MHWATGSFAVLDDVVVHLGIVQGLEEFIAFARVVESDRETGTTPCTASSSSSRATAIVDVVDAAAT